jgi:hypothetical protein
MSIINLFSYEIYDYGLVPNKITLYLKLTAMYDQVVLGQRHVSFLVGFGSKRHDYKQDRVENETRMKTHV